MTRIQRSDLTGILAFRDSIKPVMKTAIGAEATPSKNYSMWAAGGIIALVVTIFVGTLNIKPGSRVTGY